MNKKLAVLIVFAFLSSGPFHLAAFGGDKQLPHPPQSTNDPKPERAQSSLIPKFYLKGIPDVMQMNNYSCGVAAFQGVAMHFGYWGYQEEFAKILKTSPEEGTSPIYIVKGFKKLGFHAEIKEKQTIPQIKQYLRDGWCVIVDFQAWNEHPEGKDYSNEWEDGHYGILVGYNDDTLFIEDPSLLGTVGYLSNEEFMSRWHDYENENGKRREYNQMVIIVKGRTVYQRQFTHID